MKESETIKMTYEEMIDSLKGLVFGTFDRTTAKEREALDLAIKVLEKARWIPISAEGYEPIEEGRYLLCLNDNYIDVVYYAGQAWNFWFGIGQKPTAYMPLPEPYKAENDKKSEE